jgi:hypothetical protein
MLSAILELVPTGLVISRKILSNKIKIQTKHKSLGKIRFIKLGFASWLWECDFMPV